MGLSMNVIRNRFRYRQSLGSGKEARLEKAIRIHGNFSEYVPLILILMGFLEMGGSGHGEMHFFGVCLLLGRGLHVIGLVTKEGANLARQVGMLATFTSLIGVSIKLIVIALEKGL